MSTKPQGLGPVPPTLGRYEILKRLAVGGMAEIFLACASGIQGFEKYVVVKRILPKYAQDPHFVRMFLDEARLAAGLDHHNIGQVHDIGQDGEQYFFAMEYLHGVNVRELLLAARGANRPVPFEHALAIGTRVAAALEYAHDKCGLDGSPLRLVHRDVAPANVVVTYDGGVKLVDFGIARARTQSGGTQAGKVKGKISYMSPEQCRGEPIDGRSDIFSLGIVLYELTTATQLFKRGKKTRAEVMQRIVGGDVEPPSRKRKRFPPTLEAIIMRALSVSRDKRFQTASDLLTQLETFAKAQGLSLSSSALARYVRDLVGYRPEPWRADSVDSALAARTRKRLETMSESRDIPIGEHVSPSQAEPDATPGAKPSTTQSGASDAVPPETSPGFSAEGSGSVTGASGHALDKQPTQSRRRLLAGIGAAVGIAAIATISVVGGRSDGGETPAATSIRDGVSDSAVPAATTGSAPPEAPVAAGAAPAQQPADAGPADAGADDDSANADETPKAKPKAKRSRPKRTRSKRTRKNTRKTQKKPPKTEKWNPNNPFPPSRN